MNVGFVFIFLEKTDIETRKKLTLNNFNSYKISRYVALYMYFFYFLNWTNVFDLTINSDLLYTTNDIIYRKRQKKMSNYNHIEIERKWRKYWAEHDTFHTDIKDFSKPKYYVLDMFPYPSGDGLHVGHVEGYTATDIVARYKRMQGFNVLHPLGFDAYGLPAEQFAIKTGNHPADFTNRNIANFIEQMQKLGLSADWSKQISTCEPEYYKWTQWIFEELYKAGLAKRVDMPVNWCEELGTVLANDEVIDGKSERGGYPVVKKNMKQWVVKITDFCDRLLSGMKELDWPKSTLEMQANWIGKSQGAQVTFKVDGFDETFEIFTTRPDTMFGATYCVLAPEHNLVDLITTDAQNNAVQAYKSACASKTDLERGQLNKDKTGVFTGAYAINPMNGAKLPIYIADYVMASYGTGAIMAVPAHDERDYEFAKKYNLPIVAVLAGGNIENEAFEGDGLHINSGFLDGLNKADGIARAIAWLEEKGVGTARTTYKMRDWIFARQRYWGEPMPVIYLENGQTVLEKNLPLKLPMVTDYRGHNGNAPLDNATEWKNVVVDGIKGVRETNTMPGSAASSWYFLRYIDPHNDEKLADFELLKHWMPVDLYVGGPEHAVGHLLYSRMWNKFLHDIGVSPCEEPFKRLVHQGMILGTDSQKMSKSKGNVVKPDDCIESHGADALRLYEMFMGPITDTKPWNTNGIDGARKFIERVWRLYDESGKIKDEKNVNLELVYHQTVKKVTEDFETLSFNTAISQLMIFVNAVYKENIFPREYALSLLKMLNPIAPYFTEELWQKLGNNESIAYAEWPKFDAEKAKADEIEIPVQINGKVRAKIMVARGTSVAELQKIAVAEIEHLMDAGTLVGVSLPLQIKKIVAVPDRIVNIIL